MSVLLHMTWRGRYEAVADLVWKLTHCRVPDEDRCFMGQPVGGWACCPRRAEWIWCKKHAPAPSQERETPTP